MIRSVYEKIVDDFMRDGFGGCRLCRTSKHMADGF